MTDGAAIAAADIGWRVGGAQILEDVTVEVRPGELLGIIGPNGAGKSSLLNILSGVLRPTAGQVML
ncbi:MAG TPA: ATP-binding cassette domain-containing protein, partial [Lapillicoccus sp.]|nr:ATP-binding cassette domain-containing protein [Lapillicoccus sp.]